MRVLVVEDHDRMADMIRRGLEEDGYAVDLAATGEDALWMASENPYDTIVLDVMLPAADGFEVCRSLRAAGCWAPVLLLTAKDAVDDRVRGLDAGAPELPADREPVALRQHDIEHDGVEAEERPSPSPASASILRNRVCREILRRRRPPPAYSGRCESTMMRGSVISSIAKRRPSRPKPESFDPP